MLNKMRLLTPGPTPLPETVRLALGKDMIHHRKKDFQDLMHAAQEKLRLLFGTSNPVLPLACSGTGAMTAAVYSLFKPGERVLVVESGKFGERWREIAISRGLQTTTIKTEWGQAVQPEMVAEALSLDTSIKGVLIQLCETSTGVLQPIQEIAKATAGREALLVVDGISAVGISPCPMDEWGIDCLLTGSQKGLMLPPGLALVALSAKSWEKAKSIEPGCYYFNLPNELKKLQKGETNFTTPINLIFGLDASLTLILENGLQTIYEKQWALTMLTRKGVERMGLKLLAEKNFAWGVTSILLPEGVEGKKVLDIALQQYGVCMAGGQDRLKGKIARIGHMGWVDWSDCLAGLYALDQSIKQVGGFCAARDYLEYAMAAYRAALISGPGVMPSDAMIRA